MVIMVMGTTVVWSDKERFDVLEHLDDDVEVWPIHRVLIPALLEHCSVLGGTIRWYFAQVRPGMLLNDR